MMNEENEIITTSLLVTAIDTADIFHPAHLKLNCSQ